MEEKFVFKPDSQVFEEELREANAATNPDDFITRNSAAREYSKIASKMAGRVATLQGQLVTIEASLERAVDAQNHLARVSKQIEHHGLFMSDHATLRYLQRIIGIEVEALRDEILPPDLLKSIEDNGLKDGEYTCPSHRVVVRRHTITTVMPNI